MGQASSNPNADALASLSPRELYVFSYLVNGLRVKDIADLLEISPETVDTYRTSLMRKLSVVDLVGLVRFGIEYGEGLAGVSVPVEPRLPHRPPQRAAAEPPKDRFFEIE